MSHFTVLVPADDEQDLASILEPWEENCDSALPRQYTEFTDREDELHEEAKEIITDDSVLAQGHPKAIGMTRLEFLGQGDFEKFCKEWAGLDRDPIKGRFGYWQNPDAKWDWYSVGGRWTGQLQLRQIPTPENVEEGLVGTGRHGVSTEQDLDPTRCDWAPMSWINWDWMRKRDFEGSLKRFRTVQKARAMSEEADIESLLDLDEYREGFKKYLETRKEEEETLEGYIRYRLFDKALSEENIFLWGLPDNDLMDMSEEEFVTKYKVSALFFAFVIESHWVQRAQMGFWGLSRDPNEDYDAAFWTFIKELEETSPDQRVYLVDCHI